MAESKEYNKEGMNNEAVFKEASSPKTYNKKEKTKYQAFRSDEEDSSDVDETDASGRTRRKIKKERSNTFKVKIKNIKSKKKDKEKEKEKEKKKKTKKSLTSGDEGLADSQDAPLHDPVFGVSLDTAVERSGFPDKIELPRIVRECILYVEEKGLDNEGIYRVSGVKSKVDALKQIYNEGHKVNLDDYDPNTVASLLKLYLRELPSNVLTTRLAPIFDACVGLEDSREQVRRFQQLINDLPCPNKTLLGWLFIHFSHVMENNSETKMNIQNLSIVFSPTMSISHGVLNILFTHTKELFPDTELIRYIPPEEPEEEEEPVYPDTIDGLQKMLQENEDVLSQLHDHVNQGGNQDEALMDELWERQRRSTQIKRKIKTLTKLEKQKIEENTTEELKDKNNSTEAVASTLEEPTEHLKKKEKAPPKPKPPKKNDERQKTEIVVIKSRKDVQQSTEIDHINTDKQEVEIMHGITDDSHYVLPNKLEKEEIDGEKDAKDEEDDGYRLLLLEEQKLIFENEELLAVSQLLKNKIHQEQVGIERLKEHLCEYQNNKENDTASSSSSSSRNSSSLDEVKDSESEEDNIELELILNELENENNRLKVEGSVLIANISSERKLCIEKRTEIRLLEMKLSMR